MSDWSMNMKEKHFFCQITISSVMMRAALDTSFPCLAQFLPSLIETFSSILNQIPSKQQYIVSLDFSHLFFILHPRAGSSFKQDDVWRMQLNGSYRNRGLNLQFLFIPGTVENEPLFLGLPLLWYICISDIRMCVKGCLAKCGHDNLTHTDIFCCGSGLRICYLPNSMQMYERLFSFAERRFSSVWGMLRGAWNSFIKLEGRGVFDS